MISISNVSEPNPAESLEIPQFSTLNADVIPSASLLEHLEQHQPKVSPDLIKQIWQSQGVNVSDNRILTAASCMLEI